MNSSSSFGVLLCYAYAPAILQCCLIQ